MLAPAFRVATPIQEVEKQRIAHTLKWANDSRQKAAALLGISRQTLYHKIAKYGL